MKRIVALLLPIWLSGCVAYQAEPSYAKRIAEVQCEAEGLEPESPAFDDCRVERVQRILEREPG